MWNTFSILDWDRTFHPSLYTRNLPCASSLPYSARTNLQITGLLVTCLCCTTCVPKCCFHRLFAHQTLQRLGKACLAAHDQIHMNQTTTCNALSFWLATGCFKSKHHLPALLIPRQCLAFSFAELDGLQETQSCDVAWACHGLSIAFYPVVYHHFPYQNLVKWECTMVYPMVSDTAPPMPEVPMRSLFRTCWRYLFHRRLAPKIWPFFRGWDDFNGGHGFGRNACLSKNGDHHCHDPQKIVLNPIMYLLVLSREGNDP